MAQDAAELPEENVEPFPGGPNRAHEEEAQDIAPGAAGEQGVEQQAGEARPLAGGGAKVGGGEVVFFAQGLGEVNAGELAAGEGGARVGGERGEIVSGEGGAVGGGGAGDVQTHLGAGEHVEGGADF